MFDVVSRLSDRLLQRLVPKTTATACVGVQASWTQHCYCADRGSPEPYDKYPNHWISQYCITCGGSAYCGDCNIIEGARC